MYNLNQRCEEISYGKFINISYLLQEFYAKVNMVKLKDIICKDVTSLNFYLIRNYGYFKKGKSKCNTNN